MYLKPKGFDRVGFIQCFLAAFFVLWFLILPADGKYFAWPVVPELTAMFLGAGFILRSYFGYHLWRDKYWYTLRWSMYGDFAFLSVLFITTWWHVQEMNWNVQGVSTGLRIFCLIVTHVWILAYTFEPLTVFLLHPRDPEANAALPAQVSEGPLLPQIKSALIALFYLGAALWALFFFTPEFANSRWPWALNAFDARIMSAWFAGVAVWSVTMYFLKDWAEVKVGVRAIMFFLVGLLGVWVTSSWRYPLNDTKIAVRQGWIYALVVAVMVIWLFYAYWKQEQAHQNVSAIVSAH